VTGVLAAKAAVLAQGDAIGIVALALVGLVVAMFALLAGEGDSDSYVSAGHDQKSLRSVDGKLGRRKTPPKREVMPV
jgi:hypothetical protein